MKNIIFVSLIALFTSGCQSAGLYLANLGNDASSYALEANIAYGPEPWQKLDVYRPQESQGETPAIVFYYGGSWVKGSKDGYGFIANRFVQEGYTVIVPDYVKFPDGKYPAFVEDAALVTQWLSKNSAGLQIDPAHIHLMGHSAGAHVGAMLISDEKYLQALGLRADFYASFVGLAGPYDFVPKAERYKRIFGPEERYPLMQASRFIDGTEPPMLLLGAGQDILVAPSNLEKFEAAIRQKDGRLKTITYPTLGHMTLVGSLSASVPLGDEVADDILSFLSQASNL